MLLHIDIAENLELVRLAINRAARQAGRSAGEITLVGVTKTVAPDRIMVAIERGLTDLGENRVQEAAAKMEVLGGIPINWHLIGTLQTNKVKYILPRVKLIHSLDRWALAKEIDSRAEKLRLRANCLVEVNVAGESSKAGRSPAEVYEFIRTVASDCPHVSILGLMTVAPHVEHVEEVRPYFRQLRELFDSLAKQAEGYTMQHLSMGMSNDFEVAIAEGATIVRIGTAIFGRR